MITDWLKRFKECWELHDVQGVLALFAEDVVYYETPFQKLVGVAAVAKEWEVIHEQRNILLQYELFSQEGNKYAVVWSLTYKAKGSELRKCKGTYLIVLDAKGLCTYFHHTGESF